MSENIPPAKDTEKYAGDATTTPAIRNSDRDPDDDAVPFERVLARELDEIDDSRKAREVPGAGEQKPFCDINGAHARHLIGLAFSGGGIRSATFNLGVLQGLAGARLLSRIDYLSTVSGGGYIGSWLAAWVKRQGEQKAGQGIREVQESIAARPQGSGNYKEPDPVNFLRDYSNYLTPRKGIFGADTWAAVAIYLRSFLLNFSILTAGLASLLLIPLFEGRALVSYRLKPWFQGSSAVAVFVLLALIPVALIAANLRRMSGKPKEPSTPFYGTEKGIQILIVLPLFFAALILCGVLWRGLEQADLLLSAWVQLGMMLYLAPWLIAGGVRFKGKKKSPPPALELSWDDKWEEWILFGGALFAGAFGGALLWLFVRVLHSWDKSLGSGWHVAAFGPPLVVLIFLAVGVLHLGLIGRSFPDNVREWWGRLGGWLLLYCLFWISLFGISIYAPFGVALLAGWVKLKSAVVIGWIGSTVGGLLAGRSSDSSGKPGGKSTLEIVGVVAPYLFIVGLLALLSLGIREAGVKFASPQQPGPSSCGGGSVPNSGCPELASRGAVSALPSGSLPTSVSPQDSSLNLHLELQMHASEKPAQGAVANRAKHWNDLNGVPALYWFGGCIVLAVLAALLSWRVDINEFSMHMLYRNRLVRCYLGASRAKERTPNPFTGFDPNDDLKLSQLRVKNSVGKTDYVGPFPIVNAALNVTHGERLAWQERKAESFVFTPLYSGYDFPELGLANGKVLKHAYRPTRKYGYPDGGVFVGTAMGISGAAASPNMGYHTSPPLAFLMTVFNVRLGWWMGNPRHRKTWDKGGPRLGLFYLLAELFASTTDRSRFVYLSDGGHFENLGIYELVRRRCSLIIACDADADPGFELENLGNAIRKCRSDLGIPIDIHPETMRPHEDEPNLDAPKRSDFHFIRGDIQYGVADSGKSTGILIYLKTSLTQDDPADVQSYATAHDDFPQQTTADQWFDESQFESYRVLGETIADRLMGHLEASDRDKKVEEEDPASLVQWFDKAFASESKK